MLHLSPETSVLQHSHHHAYQDAISAVQSAMNYTSEKKQM
jgi:hypothetical protein